MDDYPPSSKTVALSGQMIATSSGRASISTTAMASMIYNQGAERFSKVAKTLDDESVFNAAGEVERNRIATELQETSLAAVIMASLAVEAAVNELFLDHELFGRSIWFKGIPDDVAKALSGAFDTEVDTYPTMVKCQIALAIAGKSRLDFGRGAAQEMRLLIELRNALVHHRPVTVAHGNPPHESKDLVERQLAKRFSLAKIFGNTAPFRWRGCLGAGCAEWATKTSKGFQKEFFDQLGAIS